jgi:hypothetical protein
VAVIVIVPVIVAVIVPVAVIVAVIVPVVIIVVMTVIIIVIVTVIIVVIVTVGVVVIVTVIIVVIVTVGVVALERQGVQQFGQVEDTHTVLLGCLEDGDKLLLQLEAVGNDQVRRAQELCLLGGGRERMGVLARRQQDLDGAVVADDLLDDVAQHVGRHDDGGPLRRLGFLGGGLGVIGRAAGGQHQGQHRQQRGKTGTGAHRSPSHVDVDTTIQYWEPFLQLHRVQV